MENDNVTPLRQVQKLPNEQLVNYLKFLLNHAEQGNLVDIVVISTIVGQGVVDIHSLESNMENYLRMIGSMEVKTSILVDHMKGLRNEITI